MKSKKTIPFSPPFIDEDVEKEVLETLKSGWITSGPKVKELEFMFEQYTNSDRSVCVNSWTSGAFLALKFLGIGPGDEVIVPAYTYSATALCVLHTGAKPIMVDVQTDFNIDPSKIEAAITNRTKAVIPVDFGGWPCDYKSIQQIIESDKSKSLFTPGNEVQKKLGRIAIVGDCAHSFGAKFLGVSNAIQCDFAVYSLHAVKNITTAEGGVICINLPPQFNVDDAYHWFSLNRLNGQTKDSFSKTKAGSWRYDIACQGYKLNMPDICAAIGTAQLKKYEKKLLVERKAIFERYSAFFETKEWAETPTGKDHHRESSFHLYALRIKNVEEKTRDKIIDKVSLEGVSVNVHFIPMPMMTLFRELEYKIEDYPITYDNYAREISLPIYPGLSMEDVDYICENIENAYLSITK